MWNVGGTSISSEYPHIHSTAHSALFLLLFLGVVSCGKKGGPEAPSTPAAAPVTVMEAPQKTSLSVAVEGLAPEEQGTVLLSNPEGKEIARTQTTDGKAALETLLQSGESGFFAVKIKREGAPDLDAGVKIETGQKDIAVRVTPATTLAFFLAKTYNASAERALRRAIEFYEPLLRSLEIQNPGLVERAFLELQTLPKDAGTFTGGANAFRQILDEVFFRLHSDTSQ